MFTRAVKNVRQSFRSQNTHSKAALRKKSGIIEKVQKMDSKLTDEQLKTTDEIRLWFSDTSVQTTAKLPGTNINRNDLKSLDWVSSEWLTDEVINGYINLLCNQFKNVIALSSHLLNSLTAWGYRSSARQFTKKVDVFSKEYVFVPVNWRLGDEESKDKPNHWSLAAIDIQNKKIKMYDSFGRYPVKAMEKLLTYLEMEYFEKHEARLDIDNWSLVNVENIPKQRNSSDCGVFVCQYALSIAKNEHPTFSQHQATYFRRKMAYELSIGKLIE